jgi:16S rRNA (adenine1518-N6/adenine1519-N6)-dimethyltransferase
VGRRFGQHFLNKKSILDRMADLTCGEQAPLVVEIGPGRGALTEPLLERASKVVAIEVDPVLVLYLRKKFAEAIAAERLALIEGDILRTELDAWGPAAIAGNLPYYITSPILERVFHSKGWLRGVFLVQAEVASRMCASPGNRDYGYFSILVQTHARVERILEVSRTAFRPPPKVDSAVVQLTPSDALSAYGIENLPSFLKFASNCFRHKRKTLRNNLLSSFPRERVEAVASGRVRAEALTIGELATLHRSLLI